MIDLLLEEASKVSPGRTPCSKLLGPLPLVEKSRTKAKWGIGLLIAGFGDQLVGTLLER